MKRLSESLIDLAARVKRLEDSAAAIQQNDRAVLQSRRDQLETDFEHRVEELDKSVSAAAGAARNWCSDTKNSIQRQVAAMRADFEKRQAELKERDAALAAELAEDAAALAVTLADYCVDAAEWAVVRAGLVRGQADELAARR